MVIINGKNVESKVTMRVMTKYCHKIGVPAAETFEFFRRRMTFEDALQVWIMGLQDKTITLEQIDKAIDDDVNCIVLIFNDVVHQIFPPADPDESESSDTNDTDPNGQTPTT